MPFDIQREANSSNQNFVEQQLNAFRLQACESVSSLNDYQPA